jgi:hypothetical protein
MQDQAKPMPDQMPGKDKSMQGHGGSRGMK